MKKILSLLISLGLIICSVLQVSAISKSSILSIKADEEITSYAKKVSVEHFYSISKNLKSFGMKEAPLENYSLGGYFTVYNMETNEVIYFYTVICEGELEALLQITKEKEEFNSTLGQLFSKEIKQLLQTENNEYKLVTDGCKVYAVSHKETKVLCELYEGVGKERKVPSFEEIYFSDSNIYNSTFESLLTTIQSLYPQTLTRGDVNRPISYKTVNVKGVSQGKYNICWAATCAALTNYYKKTTLTAWQVAKYIFPNNPNQGGTWTNMKKAYNHWGLYPTQTNRISFSSIKSRINSNKPMHLGLTNHSVALIGYEAWEDRNMLILLEPNGGIHKSVTLKSNGNFNYYLSGNDSWKFTRTF